MALKSERLYVLLIAAAAVLNAVSASAIGTPPGFAKGTTGGGSADPVYPQNIWELKYLLCSSSAGNYCTDNTPRVIILDGTFDFRGSEGTITETGCFSTVCPSGQSEKMVNYGNCCNGRTLTTITYDKAGRHGRLLIGSNKTLLGRGSNAIIQGIGLYIIGGVSNVIIQNVNIVDINSGIVWAGDAITIDNASKVWIDHCYFARIGRQMIVTGFNHASFVTISNNYFDGTNEVSASCDGKHYWLWLFLGNDDTITVARNLIVNTSGRSPGIGGYSSQVKLHLVNNHFKHISGAGVVQATGTANVLMEGNHFENVGRGPVSVESNPGKVFGPMSGFTDSSISTCSSPLGRACVVNTLYNSGSNYLPVDSSGLSAFSSYRDYLIYPMDATKVAYFVKVNAGVGKIN